jgi:tRNA nucleotidyltransferase (CCA-adding enzyme)
MPVPETDTLPARLRSQPWAPRLLDALDGAPGVHLVGGAVRDLLLGGEPLDLDLVVVGDAAALAQHAAARLAGEARVHERFGTATVAAGDLSFDVVSARSESYPAPGALPQVRAGSLEEDLARRDFTINAIAAALDPGRLGELTAEPRALEDLRSGVVRVLHDGSFRDDPTRVLRAVRYATRLGFDVDARTADLARAAAGDGALDTVSGQRIRDELLDLLAEPRAAESLGALDDWGVSAALLPGLRTPGAVLQRALDLAPADARRDLVALGAYALGTEPDALAAFLDRLGLEAPERAAVAAGAHPDELRDALESAARPSEIAAAAGSAPPEAVALAGATGPAEEARRWLEELRHVHLEIGGEDLLAAGAAEGPAIGAALRAALARKLDGELEPGRDAELAAALDALRAK